MSRCLFGTDRVRDVRCCHRCLKIAWRVHDLCGGKIFILPHRIILATWVPVPVYVVIGLEWCT
jgi:hypothetical protein